MHDASAVAHVFEQVHRAMEQCDDGLEVVTLSSGDPVALLQAGATELAHCGFVPIMANRESGRLLSKAMLHRHLLVICADEPGERVAIDWIRSLAQASPRRHLIVRVNRAPGERRASEQGARRAGPFVAARLARAERWIRRGRARTADCWLKAAAHAARRRGDEAVAAQIETECAKRSLDDDRIEEADRRIHTLLRLDLDWSTYWAAAVLRADVLIAREQLAHARAWLSSLVAEAQLREEPVPGQMRARLVELDFWQGRNSRADAVKADTLEADEAGWTALRAWSRGNFPLVSTLAARLSAWPHDGSSSARWWAALLRVLPASRASIDDVTRRVEALTALGKNGACRSARARRLGIAISARAWLAHGRTDAAVGVLQLEPIRGPGPESSVCRRLLATASAPPSSSHVPERQRHRQMAAGVEFLASRSITMHLVDGLSGLLAVIEDSEDDAAVLAGGCRWVCRQAGASAVAVVSVDGLTLLAAEGWRRADLPGEIAGILSGPARDARLPDQDSAAGAFGVSVRYGGVIIGHVVARGRPADRPAVQQAAQALAALCGSALRARLDAVTAPQRARESVPEIVGDSPLMHALREAITRAAPAPFPVLIEGESGTGKELVARALHRLGPRRDRRLCAVNCAALTDDLVEAELFGHARGAFTGAVGARTGLFEDASGGTVFLDEVTELSARAQAKLLRVLQEREIRRVGENASRAIDVRVVAACNVSLADAVAGGRFRDDLRFRLAVIRIRLPALRERVEDLPSLARLFWRRAAKEGGTRAMLGPDALVRLARHDWPGNVRELQNVVAGLVVAAPGRGRVTARLVDQVLAHATPGDDPGVRLEAARRTLERRVVASALVRHAGRRTAAASELGLTRQGLTKALRRLGLADHDDEDAAGVA